MRSRVQSVVAVALSVSSAAWGQADLVGWGSNGDGESSRPLGISGWLTAVDCGEHFTVALRSTGGVAGWGRNDSGQLNVPLNAGQMVQIDAGTYHVVGLAVDGRVLAWGRHWEGQVYVPSELGTCIDIAAGHVHSLAVTSSGLVRAWGSNSHGERDVPIGMGPAIDVVAGNHWSLARLANGTIRAWGYNGHGETVIPAFPQAPSKVVAGSHHALALIPGGTVVAWGRNGSGESTVPADLPPVVDVAAGYHHSLALLADGSIRAWGWNENGQSNVPPGVSARLIAGGVRHSVALTTCESAGGPADCDNDGITDLCELAAGAPDANGNGRPDGCDPPWSPSGATAGAREWTGPVGSGYGRHWFFLSTERVDFPTAKQRARDLGGRLAVITSAEEWSFVNGLLGENPNFAYWVGLERISRCAPWQTATGEPFGLWNPTWAYDNCDDFAVSVSGVGGWRSSRPTELRRYIVEFDFADLNNDGVADSQQPSMTGDCNGNGLRDSAELRFSPQLDCNGNGTVDSCDVRRVPFYVDQEWLLPVHGSPVESSIAAGAGTSTDVTVRISAIGDLGETFKGEYVDVEVEGLGTVRVGGQDCQWVSVDRGIPAATAVAALADGSISVRLAAGADVDASSCATGVVRVQMWWSLPTSVADLNGNGRPDTCDTTWTPDLGLLPGVVQRSPGHWYWVSNENRDWAGAAARAREFGGQLLTVTSDAEMDFIRNGLQLHPHERFHVGLTRPCGDLSTESFTWLTGEPRRWNLPFFYNVLSSCDWLTGVIAPGMGFAPTYRWEHIRYIVEFDFRDCNSNGQLDMFEMLDPSKDKDLDGQLDECGPTTGPDCDSNGVPDRWAIEMGASPDANGNWRPDSCDFAWQPAGDTATAVRWERGLSNRHWYLFVQSSVPYGEAKEVARRMGGHLASVTSPEEAAFLESRMRSIDGNEREWWIGMERPFNQTSMTSLFWVTGEPKRYEPYWFGIGAWNSDAVAINTHRGWRTAPRNEHRWYIVEFDFRDSDSDGQFDWRELTIDPSLDCDGDGLLDSVQMAAGISDCNQNGVPDRCDIAAGMPDANGNGRPDACDGSWTPAVSYPGARQLVRNGIGGRWYWVSPEWASYDLAKQRASTMGGRLVTVTTSMEASFLRNELMTGLGNEEFWVGMERPQGQCETSQFRWITGEARRYVEGWHYNACWSSDAAAIRSGGDYRSAPRGELRRYIVEFDLADCNQNGTRDWQEMLEVSRDVDANGLLDACELSGGFADCNQNGIHDAADIAAGMPDTNGNGRPDSCDLAWQPTGGAAGAVRWTYGGGTPPGGGGHWYLASTERLDYFTAKEAARAMGGRLATVTSQAEWDFVRTAIGGDPNRSYWIGIERPCNCCPWQAISGEPFGGWTAPWSLNDCNVAASVSVAANWRSSSPFELRHYLVEFDFTDLDGDGVLDAGQAAQQVDCNGNGIRDVVETLVFPTLDCDSNGRIDSCDTARTPFYAQAYADLPASGGELTVALPVNPGTSSPVRVRVEAIGDLGEPFKGETVDVSIEGLATLRMPAGQCGWVGDERTFPVATASPAIVDGVLSFTVTVGNGVDLPACGENRIRVQAWYELPTAVADLNRNGWPDSCEIGSQPPSGLTGLVQRGPGHWYWLSDDSRDYNGALARARELGGHVVTVTSASEWRFLQFRMGLAADATYWMGMERPCQTGASTSDFAWTTAEVRRFNAPWYDGAIPDCNWRWALMSPNRGWRTGYAWWCCHRYIVEFDFRDGDGNGRLDMYDDVPASLDCDGDGERDSYQIVTGDLVDDNSDGIPDCCVGGLPCDNLDCNSNGLPDMMEIFTGRGFDMNANGRLDECEQAMPWPRLRHATITRSWCNMWDTSPGYGVWKIFPVRDGANGALIDVMQASPQMALRPGVYDLRFVGAFSDCGPPPIITLWLGDALAPSISALAGSPVTAYGANVHYFSGPEGPGANVLGCDVGVWRVTVLDFSWNCCGDDQVGTNAAQPDGSADGVATIRLEVRLIDQDGDGIRNEEDSDDDNDGVPDTADALPLDPTESVDTDGDGIGNNADTDDDGDGAADADDGCPLDVAKTVPGACGCGVPDTDTDGDLVADCIDNCPSIANAGQADCNGDGVGDACHGEAILLADHFDDGALDPARWTTALPFGCSEVQASDGFVALTGRGRLQSAQQYVPDGDRMEVQFRWRPMSGDELFMAYLRTNLSYQGNCCGSLDNGIALTYYGSDLYVTAIAPLVPISFVESGPQSVTFGEWYRVSMVSTPGQLEVVVVRETDPAWRWSGTLVYSGTSLGEYLAFESREFCNTRSDIDDVRVIRVGPGADCNSDGVPDECQVSETSDCDGNGVLDSCDIAAGAPDSNSNGIPDSCELQPGDLNADGVVDGVDLGMLLAQWGAPAPQPGDLNDDGEVDGIDLGILLANWGPGSG